MNKLLLFAVLLSGFAVAVASRRSNAGSVESGVSPYTSLDAFVRDVKANIERIANRDSGAFIPPSADEVAQFGLAMDSLLTGDTETARSILDSLSYDLFVLNDDSGASYWVAQERANGFRGQGTYIVDTQYRRNVVVEVPHPIWDSQTPEEGVAVLQGIGARALFIAGTHRCANPGTPSGCSGTTTSCQTRDAIPVRISDAPHFTGNFMFSAHGATLRLTPPAVSLNLHGNNAEPYDIEISDGTRVASDETTLVNQLRNSLRARTPDAGSCNWSDDHLLAANLCGTMNAQGRLSNGSSRPCTLGSLRPSGLFLHIEQHRNIRDNPGVLIDALLEVIP